MSFLTAKKPLNDDKFAFTDHTSTSQFSSHGVDDNIDIR